MEEELKRVVDKSVTLVRSLLMSTELGNRIENVISRSELVGLGTPSYIEGGVVEAEAELRYLVDYLQRTLDRVQQLSPSAQERAQLTRRVDTEIYCTCKKGSFGDMVACDNPGCDIEWFHMSCVNLTELPRGLWYCPQCRKELGLRQHK